MLSKMSFFATGLIALAVVVVNGQHDHDHGPGSDHGPHDHSPGSGKVGGITKSGKTYYVSWAPSPVPLPGIHAGVGEYVIFEYDRRCDIYAFSNAAAFNACDFGSASAKLVAGPNIGGGIGGMNKFEAPLNSEGVLYLGCSIGNACRAGNVKLMLQIQDGESGHLHGPGGAHGAAPEPEHDHNAPGHVPHDHVASPEYEEHDHNAPGHVPHDHVPAAPSVPAPKDVREPSVDGLSCVNEAGKEWAVVGPGYCREKSCPACMGTLTFASFCAPSMLACQAECEATANCVGISYIERVDHVDGDRCQANELGRCLLYTGSKAVGGSQTGSRQAYTCMSYSAASSSGSTKGSEMATPDGPPSGARMVAVAKSTKTSLDVVWAAPLENWNAGVDTYTVEMVQGKGGSKVTVPMADPTDTTVTVKGLKPKTPYQFMVTAINSEGSSKASKTKGRTRK